MTRIIIMLALLVTASVPLSAQDNYSIRVNTATNVRISHDTQSAKIGTIPAGTEVDVLGEWGRWLQIVWQGRTGWIAGWLGHTWLTKTSNPDIQLLNTTSRTR